VNPFKSKLRLTAETQQNYNTVIFKDKSMNKADSGITVVNNKKFNDSENDSRPTSEENRLSFIHQPLSQRQSESINEHNTIISVDKFSTPKASSSSKLSCNPITVLKSHFDSVREIALSQDRKYLISVSEDMLINLWDFKKTIKTSKEVFEPFLTLRGHTKPIFSLASRHNDPYNNISFFTGGNEVDLYIYIGKYKVLEDT
jgi:WD40 repeat protein